VRKLLVLLIVVMLFLVTAGSALAASEPLGPNPLAGDGIPDGSSLASPYGPMNSDGGEGPAPSSGDGDPAGSGF